MPTRKDGAPPRRGSAERIREILTANDPGFGADLDEGEWAPIAERIASLTRLLCEIGQRIAAENPTVNVRDAAACPFDSENE